MELAGVLRNEVLRTGGYCKIEKNNIHLAYSLLGQYSHYLGNGIPIVKIISGKFYDANGK
jgi:hypothetical protein